MPGVMLSCFAFFTSCALELTAGSWSASFFVNTKGVDPDRAALIAMLFYVGLAGGRFLSGLFSARLGRRRILRIALVVLPLAVILYILPLSPWISAVALLLIGLGVGPIYPNLVHLTPTCFGEDVARSVMGIQQAMTYAGILIMPWIFGLLADRFSTALLPYYLMLLCLGYMATLMFFMRTVGKSKEE